MQRDLVERRGWIDRRQFLNGVALGQTMPGPLAAQVVMWIGFLQRGALGALAICLPFILPTFAVVLGIAYFYTRYQGLDWVQALFYGIGPGVLAIIALAAVKLARLTNTADVKLWAIAGVTLGVTAATGAEIALIFLGGGAFVLVARHALGHLRAHPGARDPHCRRDLGNARGCSFSEQPRGSCF